MVKPSSMLIVCFLLAYTMQLKAQCLTPPPLDSCNGSEATVSDNEILSAGVKKWYFGPPATFNELTMRGGTLVVCGNLTVDKFYMDSGTIVIRPGGRFVIGGGLGYGIDFRGNCALYNYGTFKCVRNLGLTNSWASASKPNVVMNVTPASVFEMSNQYFVINNPYSFFVNKGKAEFHGIITDPGAATGSVCLGYRSETKMTVIYNRRKNAYVSPEGSSCVNVTEFSQLYDTLTSSTDINLCLGPRHYSDSSCRPWGCKPNAWGNANIFKICNMCTDAHLLTLQIRDFVIYNRKKNYELSWKTNITLSEASSFIIERSTDGKYFSRIDSIIITAENRQSAFAIIDKNPLNGFAYYRIKYLHRYSGYSSTSTVQKIYFTEGEATRIYPNPFVQSFSINCQAGKKPLRVELYNMQGKLLAAPVVQQIQENNMRVLFPENAGAGSYLLKIFYANESEMKKIFKED